MENGENAERSFIPEQLVSTFSRNRLGDRQLKICFICNEYPPLIHGGIGSFVKTLAESLAAQGADVSVVGFGKRAEFPYIQNQVKVYWLVLPHILSRSINIKGYPYSAASLLRRTYLSVFTNSLARKNHFDLVESHDFHGPIDIKPSCKFVLRLHGSVLAYRLGEGRPGQIHPLDRRAEIRQLQMADDLIAVSKYIGNLTNQALGKPLKFTIINNPIDTDMFHPMPVPEVPGRILFVGNLMWRKGIFDLVRSLPYVHQEMPEATLQVVGGIGGEYKKMLEDELAALPANSQKMVEIVGRVENRELPLLYNQAAVFAFPSRVEAFGLTCAEAMACGRPVVATSLASGPELLEDGVSGLLANPENPLEMAEKIVRLLRDQNLRRRLGENARKKALNDFDLHKLTRENLDFYHRVRG